jgi:hypothetical protein
MNFNECNWNYHTPRLKHVTLRVMLLDNRKRDPVSTNHSLTVSFLTQARERARQLFSLRIPHSSQTQTQQHSKHCKGEGKAAGV